MISQNACEGADSLLYIPNVHLPLAGDDVASSIMQSAAEAGVTVMNLAASVVASGAADLPQEDTPLLLVLSLPGAAHEECGACKGTGRREGKRRGGRRLSRPRGRRLSRPP